MDGLDQTPYVSTQQWGHPLAECQICRRDSAADYEFIDASHNGYMRLEQSVLHRRWLLLGKSVPLLLVIDWLDGGGRHEVEQRFQLHPESAVSRIANGKDHPEAAVDFPASSIGLEISWAAGGQESKSDRPTVELVPSWISEIYGSKQESACLAAKLVVEGRSGIAAAVLPQDMGLPANEGKWQL
ncbi:hypothetical protein AMQ84_05365 [Paenibacillus riograndensis]|uniref:Heparinase II/III-like C-terminal domain-containing protein n=1 Tax=Paenibacillus riograndensis TaxID=483937 RepID=A0A132U862_9BACL|nr:heparinase II/III family protein [Paenibacillus riograndensis]KWX79844.1 hypothetical protein AMQ84_05365 [Paenibacillus riograndensis]